MNYKEKLRSLSLKITELQENIKTLNNDLDMVVSSISDAEVSDAVKMAMKLKYDTIKFNDLSTWDNLEKLPQEVLNSFGNRMWLLENQKYNYCTRDKTEDTYGKNGRKSFDNWFWNIRNLAPSVACQPTNTRSVISSLKTAYNQGTIKSKEQFKEFFDILQEEIQKYESQ